MQSSGQLAVVTGAASGIGRAVALSLCRNGATVVAVDKDPQGLELLQDAGVIHRVCDITSEDQRGCLLESIESVDYLVNAAGTVRLTKLVDLTEEIWDQTMAINAKATLFLMQALAPTMASGSSIVNVASAAGKTARVIEQVDYSAAKAAVIAMTKAFALAFAARGVRVNCVCPGAIDTPATSRHAKSVGLTKEELIEQMKPDHMIKRMGEPREIANAVLFLASDEASFITATTLMVDGGYTAR